jgi:hypothetical protein
LLPAGELHALAALIGVPEEQVRDRLRLGHPIRVFAVAGKPIPMERAAADRVVGTLAFSTLTNSPVVGGDPATLAPGEIMYYDGDQPCSWQSEEEGFGLMVVAEKLGKEKHEEGVPSSQDATGVKGGEEE